MLKAIATRLLCAWLVAQQLLLGTSAHALLNVQAGKPLDSHALRGAQGASSGGTASVAPHLLTGDATMQVPIVVPPGTGGLTPGVALSYSSGHSRSDGPLGVGWTVEIGPSVIERSTRRGAPEYDASDEFELDGQLLRTTGTPGRYVTETFDHSRIEHVVTGSQDYWLILRPDGTRLYFGLHHAPSANPPNLSRSDSTLVESFEPTSGVCTGSPFDPCILRETIVPSAIPFAWHLDRVEDRNGNVVFLRWDALGDPGARYLREITYSRHVSGLVTAVPSFGGADDGTLARTRIVRFNYDALRADRIPTYRNGFRKQVRQRLVEIRSEVDGQLSRRYSLAYEQSPASGRTRLVEVADHGASEQAAAPFVHTFTYGDGGTPGWTAKDVRWALPQGLNFVSPTGQDNGIRLIDVNGDAYPDVVQGDAGTRRTFLGTANRFSASATPAWAPPVDFRTAAGYTGAEIGDFDGDGRPDILRRSLAVTGLNVTSGPCGTSRQNDVGTLTATSWLNTGAGWVASAADNPGAVPFTTSSLPSVGNPQSCPSENLNTQYALDGVAVGFDQATRVADINGDGLDDLLYKRHLLGEHANGIQGWYQAEWRAGTLLNDPDGLAFGTFNNTHYGYTYGHNASAPIAVAEHGRWYDGPRWQVPSDGFGWSNSGTCRGTQNRFAEAHTGVEKIVDLNGDGLPDLLESALVYRWCTEGLCPDTQAGAWVNNGYGWQFPLGSHPEMGLWPYYFFYSAIESYWTLNIQSNGSWCDETEPGDALNFGRRFVDVNGDGGPDLIGVNLGADVDIWDARVPIPPGYFLPTLWVPESAWTLPVSLQTANDQDTGVRLADVNADGMVDLVVSDGAYLNTAEPPDRLETVTNPFGAVTTLSYAPVAPTPGGVALEAGQRMHDAPVWVVDRIVVSPGAGFGQPDLVQDFEYYGGVYDEDDRAFRGFQTVVALGPIAGSDRSVTFTHFHVRDRLRGLPFKVVVAKAPASDTSQWTALYETLNTYAAASASEVSGTVHYPNGTTAGLPGIDSLTQTEAFQPFRSLLTGSPDAARAYIALPISTQLNVYEGLATPEVSVTEQSFDVYGNVRSLREKGDPGTSNDDVTTTTTFAVADGVVGGQTMLLANRPAEIQVLGTAAGLPSGTVVQRTTQVFYDNTGVLGQIRRGNATGVHRHWATGPPAPVWVRISQAFDVYGNVTWRTTPYELTNPGTFGQFFTTYDPASRTVPEIFTTQVDGTSQYTFQTLLEYETSGCGAPIGMGFVCRTTHPNTAQTTSQYDAFGREIATTGPIGWETATNYFDGARGTANQRTETRIRWRTSGPPVATDPDAIIELNWYDGLGRDLKLQKSGRGSDVATATMGYNAAGQVEQASRWAYSGTGPVTTYTYDVLGRLTQRVQPEGTATNLGYAPRLTLMERFDGGLKHRRVERTDAFGRLAAVEEYPNVSGSPVNTTYAYDPFGGLVRVRDAVANDPSLCSGLDTNCASQRHETLVFYDELGNRVRLEDPNTGTWLTKWSASGLPIEETDPRGMVHEMQYDPLGRITRRSLVSPANPSVLDHVYTYAGPGYNSTASRGRLIRIDDQEGSEWFSYDFAGNVIDYERTIGGKFFEFVYNHDPLGRRTRAVYPDGQRVDWHYDKRLLARIAPNTGPDHVSDVQYDPLDRVTTLGLGGSTSSPVVSETRDYQPTSGRLDLIHADAGSTSLMDLDYGVDGLGRVQAVIHSSRSTSGSYVQRLHTYQYDGLDRMTWAFGPFGSDESNWAQTYSHDALGNLRSKDVGGPDGGFPTLQYNDPLRPHALTAALDGAGVAQRQLEYDAAGNVTLSRKRNGAVWQGTTLTYDELGNLTSIGNNTMGYDSTGRRVRLVEGQSKLYFPEPDYEYIEAGTTKRVNRHYFVDGRRVASSAANWTAPSASTPALFPWRGPDLPDVPPWAWGLLYASALAGLAGLTWRRRRSGSFSPAFRATTLVVLAASSPLLIAGGPGPGVLGTHGESQLFYLTDHLGSTVLTVKSNGTVRNRYTYEPFGDPVVQEGTDVHHRFTGGHRDPTGLYSLGRRHYDPSLARFVQPDPIVADVADPQTFNRYAYALGNPLRWIDPTGLFAEEGGTGGVNWDYFIVIGSLVIPTGPPPVPNAPNAVGNVPASSSGIEGLGFQQGEWDWMSTVLSDPGEWRGAIRARFGVIGEIAYILIAEDAVDNLGTVFGDEVPMHRRAGAVLLILVEVSPGKLAKAAGKADDVYDAIRRTDDVRDAGVVYRRANRATPSEKPYIGRAKNDQRYKERQREHGRANPDADYEFKELERHPDSLSLRQGEQRQIDLHGGPTNRSNPDGGTMNKRNEIRKGD